MLLQCVKMHVSVVITFGWLRVMPVIGCDQIFPCLCSPSVYVNTVLTTLGYDTMYKLWTRG